MRKVLGAVAAVLLVLCATAVPARAATDVVVVFDTTGSMSGAIDEAKDEMRNVIDEVGARFGDVRYAVAAVSDYGAVDDYGDDGDEPWTLVQPLTDDRLAVQAAIDALDASGGGDEAEAYGRALREADTSAAIGFRPGAQRLVVLVADSVPHDDDLNEGVPDELQTYSSPFDTGVDPGPDERFGTADDIDWQTQLAELRAHGIPLYFVLFKGGSDLLGYWRHWAGTTGGSASTSGAGDLGSTLVDAISAGAGGCARSYKRVGTVDVCADAIAEQGDGTFSATGAVRVAAGLAVGDGPVAIDTGAQTVAGSGALAVVRGATTVPVGSGAFSIAAAGVNDATSGRERLATLSLDGATPASFAVGKIGLSPFAALYVDPADGGGVVAVANPLFKLRGVGPTGTLAIGLHARSATAYRVLGGSAGWSLKVGEWGIGASLQYDGGEDVWKLEGEADLPGAIGGAKVSGSLRKGEIDAIGIAAKAGDTGVPLGATGFFFDSFSGELAGLAGKTQRLKLGVTGGYGPKIPVVKKRPIALEKADVTVRTDLSGAIDGRIGLVDRRLAGGDLDVSMRMRPSFSASGRLNADVSLLGTGFFARTAIDMTSRHFTATGGAELRVAGRRAQGASAIVSDEGAGASGKPCAICPTVGVGIRWRDALKFPPQPEWIGADIERYRTTRAAAAAGRRGRVLRVAPGTAVLAVYGSAARGGEADVELVAPGGRRYRLGRRSGPFAQVVRAPDGRIAFTVLRPKPGRWRLLSGAATTVEAQRVPRIGTVRALRATPRSGRRDRLRRGRVRVRWRVDGRLPRGARVAVQRAKGRGGGVTVATAAVRRRTVTFKVRRLRRGANRLSLVVSAKGVPFRRVAVPGVVYRR
ncbi:vWA domain-containing protein [Conexibacter arvalis]|uniref:VWFA domain-containing protein n=1 Tax=Conexibacter arvalis TaxID=912552 RepID=A0A840IBF6_9ACTN|nr:vWA domain-containing protein [Conexibacter arvalis]MBB4661270.1 hypothetical protein [Conexibacter arvalis]